MFRRFFLTLGLAALTLTACQPQPSTPPPTVASAPFVIATEEAPATVEPPPAHAEVIRFALVGETHLTNVWAYYDVPGATYNNRAVQNDLWPSLFRLSPFTGAFEPYLAEGTITPLEPDSGFFASNVTLRPDLKWSDGSPLTARDVAFSVNTALDFHLDLDWSVRYNPEIVYRAEALDARTVRFYFRVQPSIQNWQYGALQGPIVNAAYWEPKLAGAYAMLTPNPELDQRLFKLREEAADLQRELGELIYQLNLLPLNSPAYQDMQSQIYDKQDEVNGAQKAIEDTLAEKESVFAAGRDVMYALDASGEPTFGPFMPADRADNEFDNITNPYYPFAPPNFDRAVYRVYSDEWSALEALGRGEANVILKQDGIGDLSAFADAFGAGSALTPSFPRSDLRALAFNLTDPFLSDTVLRQAVVCMAGRPAFPSGLMVRPLESLILAQDEFGYTDASPFPCAGMGEQARLEWSARQLEAAGYAWDVKPAWDGAARAGSGLRRGGALLPEFSILVTRENALRVAVASVVAERLQALGLRARVEEAEGADALYRVYDSHDYQMAILGWRLARYPSYLCDLFGPGNPFFYERAEMNEHCAAFRSALDLEAARQDVFVIQTLLAGDVPVAPLYSETAFDVYIGVTYPFAAVLDGIVGLYGAPGLAVPVAP